MYRKERVKYKEGLINRDFLISAHIQRRVVLLVALTVFVVGISESDYLVSCNKALGKNILSDRRSALRSTICASTFTNVLA